MFDPGQHLIQFQAELAKSLTLEAMEELRVKYLGRKSELKAELKNLGSLPPDQRAAVAKTLNDTSNAVQQQLDQATARIRTQEVAGKLRAESVDVFLPGVATRRGALHPVHAVELRCLAVLRQLGFVLRDGPEVETPYYNFDALNIPEHHPARDMQDTFWIDGRYVLRSHTTTIQARTLEGKQPLPIKVAAAGRVYRNEAVDATHLAMFHQLEGFWVDKGINFAHLKGVLVYVARALYGQQGKFRFKPKFYPYTEPSIGLDIACTSCGGSGCEACHGSGWVTIMGAGMIHGKILKMFGYDQPGVRGIAFGWGTTRMTAQWLGLDRVKSLYEQDYRLFSRLNRRMDS